MCSFSLSGMYQLTASYDDISVNHNLWHEMSDVNFAQYCIYFHPVSVFCSMKNIKYLRWDYMYSNS